MITKLKGNGKITIHSIELPNGEKELYYLYLEDDISINFDEFELDYFIKLLKGNKKNGR